MSYHEQVANNGLKCLSGQSQVVNWDGSAGDYYKQQKNIWQPETVSESDPIGCIAKTASASYEQVSHVSVKQLGGRKSRGWHSGSYSKVWENFHDHQLHAEFPG